MIISFGYHNLIPSLNNYLQGDAESFAHRNFKRQFYPAHHLPDLELVFLGIVPHSDHTSRAIAEGAMVTDLFRTAVTSPKVLFAMQVFAFFAIVTSFLTVALSFVDFTVDGLKLGTSSKARLWACFPYLYRHLSFHSSTPKCF